MKKLMALCLLAAVAGCDQGPSKQRVTRTPQPAVQAGQPSNAEPLPDLRKFEEPKCKDGKCRRWPKEV